MNGKKRTCINKLDKNKIDVAVKQLIKPDGKKSYSATATIKTTSNLVDINVKIDSGKKYHGIENGNFNEGSGTSSGYIFTKNIDNFYDNTTQFNTVINTNLIYIYFYDNSRNLLGNFAGSGVGSYQQWNPDWGIRTWS
ncbi:41051_t:CDS:2 [Gigaspora margarita]|uniref:41051_t:CDS:1 n=1 Tax=Gigaspora margarita TaxID=4874 RepID=A0ABN7V613_GIGMA|nr:41051_t:CDS:2 [Gigaspora margarita]